MLKKILKYYETIFKLKEEKEHEPYIRSCRFTLEDTIYPFYHIYIKNVHINFIKKTITFEVMNNICIFENEDVFSNKNILNRHFILTTYDRTGEKIYAFKFNVCFLIDHTTDFDYANSDVNSCKLTFQYNKKEKI